MSVVASTRKQARLCVVSPCYNEEEGVELFYLALRDVLLTLEGLDYRIIFVDDGSSDRTLERLNAIAAQDRRVRVYSLSRNFGHQIALTAGLDAAAGDAVSIPTDAGAELLGTSLPAVHDAVCLDVSSERNR